VYVDGLARVSTAQIVTVSTQIVYMAGRPVCPSVHSIETTHVAQSHLLHTPLLVMLAAEAPVSCTNSAV